MNYSFYRKQLLASVCVFLFISTLSAQINLNAGFPYGPIGTYSTDDYFDTLESKTSGNNSIVIPGGISGAIIEEEVYTSNRGSLLFNGSFSYNIPVGCGKYDVVLHFAEIYFGAPDGVACAPCTGLRVFDIDVENSQGVTTNFDVVAAAGGPVTATSLTYSNINVNDGLMTIAFTGVVESPFVSAIDVIPVALETQSTLNVTAGCSLSDNSITDGSFTISNTSPGGQEITNININLASAMLPNLVFDPTGAAGDAVGKDFTANTGAVDVLPGTHTLSGALGGGFTQLDIPFSSFDVGDVFTFSIDVDPTSIQGLISSEVSTAAIVTGAELAGSTITFTYNDGSITSGELIPQSTCDGESEAFVSSCNDLSTPAPSSTVNAASTFIFNDDQYYGLSGEVGEEVCVYIANTAFTDATLPAASTFESNDVTAWNIVCATIGASGTANVPVSLFGTVGDINRVAVSIASGANISPLSDLQIMEKAAFPLGIGECTCINVGASAALGDAPFTDSNGKTFDLDDDTYWTNGSSGHASYLPAVDPIANTVDDEIYLKDRHGFDMSFAFPGLPAGNYTVQLYFAETFHGVTGGNPAGGVGTRIMNATVEGNSFLSGFDIFDQVGPTTAIIQTYADVLLSGDGIMNIDFTKEPAAPDVPAVQGICMIANNNASIFPVELTSFYAEPASNYVDIGWTTASEVNNHFFTVERSGDARIFETIAIIPGAGTSQHPLSYSAKDINPLPQKAFYRLKQTDFDGSFSYSPVVEVNFENPTPNMKVYPNPASGNELYVDISGFSHTSSLALYLRDGLGRIVNHRQLALEAGGNMLSNLMPAKKLSPGLYVVQLTDGQEVWQKRVLVK